MNRNDPIDVLLQQARAHRAPVHLWPAIAARAGALRPRRWFQYAAAVLVGGFGYLLVAVAVRPRAGTHTIDPHADPVTAIVARTLPFLDGSGVEPMPDEQRLLRQLAARSPRRWR